MTSGGDYRTTAASGAYTIGCSEGAHTELISGKKGPTRVRRAANVYARYRTNLEQE